jgi:hypothetical protein
VSGASAERAGDWSEITGALRANLLPGLFLWAVAAVVVVVFYLVPAAQPAFARIAAAKDAWGFAFSALATGLFGGLLPWVVARLLGREMPASHGILLLVLCTWRGIEVDAFYRLQGLMWGEQATLAAIAAKVACDQLGYSVLWSSPTTIALFAWRDRGFTRAAWRAAWRLDVILPRLRAVVLCNWLVWTPTVCLVYSLPADLQIPLFSLATTFWSLTLLLLIRKRG